ncbi:MAG: sodium:solute symporter family protein [Bacteroidota bacterium]
MLSISVVVYIAVTSLLGVACARFVRSSADFLSASRKLPFALSSFALFAFWFGSETVFGASSEFIQHGFLGVIEDPFGGFLCLFLFALIFVKPLYRSNLITLGDLFRRQYGTQVEFVASIFMMLTFFGYIAAQLVALSILLNAVFGLPSMLGISLSAIVVMLYTVLGGMWAVSITDFIQSIVILVGLMGLVVYFSVGLDFSEVLANAPDGHFRFVPKDGSVRDWLDYWAAWLALGFGSLASQDIFQRANAAKSERVAIRSTYAGAFMYLIFAMIPLYLGVLVYTISPDLAVGDTQYALTSLVKQNAPMWLQVLFYGALLSAIFSTCSGALLAPASILAENILKPLVLREPDDRKFLRLSRISVLIIGSMATVLAFGQSSIYDLVAEASIFGMVSILVPMFCALFIRKSRSLGAILSMCAGLSSYLIAAYVLDTEFPALFVGFFAAIAGMAVGNYLASLGTTH